VLDVSPEAIIMARQRLGNRASCASWIVKDATDFTPAVKFDFWHDRAAFHFLTVEEDISNYIRNLKLGTKPGGYLLVSTFSDRGPDKCSGLDVRRYSRQSLYELLEDSFEEINCFNEDHKTPSDTVQNFLFCLFRRKSHSR
jgi:hypothetical protein